MKTDFFDKLKTSFDIFRESKYTADLTFEDLRMYLISCNVLGIEPKSLSCLLTPAEITDLNKIVDQDMETLFQEYQAHFGQKTQEDMKTFFEKILKSLQEYSPAYRKISCR